MAASTTSLQNGPHGEMYTIKPFQIVEVIDLPNVMYNMKSYYSSTDYKEDSTANTPIANLEKRHDDVLKRLEQLQSSVSKLGEKYQVSKATEPAIQAKVLEGTRKPPPVTSQLTGSRGTSGSKPMFISGNVVDLVINVDPSKIPLSLIIMCERLSEQFTVHKSTYSHSSVSGTVPDRLQNLLTSNGIKRGDSQVVINFVWKKVAYGPELIVDPTRQTPIQGEVNVARYLARLLNPSWDQDDIVRATQQDELLDLAQLQILEGNTKERAAAVKSLNSLLGKKTWLDGESPNIADICCWSAVQQSGQASGPPANVKKWLTSCSQHKFFETALSMLS